MTIENSDPIAPAWITAQTWALRTVLAKLIEHLADRDDSIAELLSELQQMRSTVPELFEGLVQSSTEPDMQDPAAADLMVRYHHEAFEQLLEALPAPG